MSNPIVISKKDYLEFLYDAGDGANSVEHAKSIALEHLYLKYGKYADIIIPTLTDSEVRAFKQFMDQEE